MLKVIWSERISSQSELWSARLAFWLEIGRCFQVLYIFLASSHPSPTHQPHQVRNPIIPMHSMHFLKARRHEKRVLTYVPWADFIGEESCMVLSVESDSFLALGSATRLTTSLAKLQDPWMKKQEQGTTVSGLSCGEKGCLRTQVEGRFSTRIPWYHRWLMNSSPFEVSYATNEAKEKYDMIFPSPSTQQD